MRQVVVSRRAAIAALVLPALVVVAMAARSYQPFGGEGGGRRAPSTTFLDGAFTVIFVLGGLAALVAVWAWFHALRSRPQGRRNRASVCLPRRRLPGDHPDCGDRRPGHPSERRLAWATGEPRISCFLGRWSRSSRGRNSRKSEIQSSSGRLQSGWPSSSRLRSWPPSSIDRRRDRRGRRTPEQLEELGRALDEAIDDLRRDPDPRRAVIAAYARMEQALTSYGFPRRPSEAPYEYLRRVGRELEAEEPVAALTELFEVAKFSEHSVDESDARPGDRRAHGGAARGTGGDVRRIVGSTLGYAILGALDRRRRGAHRRRSHGSRARRIPPLRRRSRRARGGPDLAPGISVAARDRARPAHAAAGAATYIPSRS